MSYAVSLAALGLLGVMVVIGIRFGIPAVRRHGTAFAGPVSLGALGLAGLVAGQGYALAVGPSPGGPPTGRLILYFVSIVAIIVAAFWWARVQHRREEARRTDGRPATLASHPRETT